MTFSNFNFVFNIKVITAGLFLMLSCSSCMKETGCTDINSLNYDYEAKDSDGSCQYTRVSFYARWSAYQGIPITRVEVIVDGQTIGTLGAVFPNGPGNCSAQGTLSYQFTSGNRVDWNTEITLANGRIIIGTGGRISPSSSQDCMRINATN